MHCSTLTELQRGSMTSNIFNSESANLHQCHNFNQKVIWDSNPDYQINPGLDVCWICPKMLRMHYLVGVGHLAKYGTNRQLIV